MSAGKNRPKPQTPKRTKNSHRMQSFGQAHTPPCTPASPTPSTLRSPYVTHRAGAARKGYSRDGLHSDNEVFILHPQGELSFKYHPSLGFWRNTCCANDHGCASQSQSCFLPPLFTLRNGRTTQEPGMSLKNAVLVPQICLIWTRVGATGALEKDSALVIR